MLRVALGIGIGSLMMALVTGCVDSLANQAKKDPNVIIGKKTDKIEEFNPKAKQEVSDSKVRADDPILYPLQAYGPMVEQISKSQIEYAVKLYEAEHGHYPKDYKEFMEGVIKPNQIKLPVLPGGWKYAYNVPEHKLMVVKDADAGPDAGKGAPAAK